MKDDVRIVINCEREYIAETLMRIASEYEHEMGLADWIEAEHGRHQSDEGRPERSEVLGYRTH